MDPVDANVVYLRAIGAGAELLAISRDGGMTFTTPITLAGGSLSAFARLASGTVLVAGLLPGDGGTTAGVAWRSGDGGVTFDDWTLTPMPRLRALAERDGRCTSRAATTATAGRWPCPPTRAGRSSRSRATTRSAR